MVQGVTKRFGSAVAVQDLNFTVERGEIFGLLGPNGAGKTTTLRLITGYMPPSAGTITVCGYDVTADPLAVKRRLGYLPENPPLYPELTVREYLGFTAGLKGVPRRRLGQEVGRVLEEAGVAEVADRLIGNLSRGYRQRVGLAQALLGRPELLVLDEPTVGLDPVQIAEIRHLIKRLAAERTVVLSSHILPEVQQLCGRVLILNQGRVAAQGTPQSLAAATGAARLEVTIKGPVAEVTRLLAALPGVAGVRQAPNRAGRENAARAQQEEEEVREQAYVVELVPGADVREELFLALAARGWPLLEVRRHQLSLEDVFLQLVTEEEPANVGGNPN